MPVAKLDVAHPVIDAVMEDATLLERLTEGVTTDDKGESPVTPPIAPPELLVLMLLPSLGLL